MAAVERQPSVASMLERGLNAFAAETRSYRRLQRVIQSQPVPKATAVDDLEGRYSAWPVVDVQGLGISDPVFETTEGNLETISPRIIGDAQQRHPFRRNLPVDGERRGHGAQIVARQSL